LSPKFTFLERRMQSFFRRNLVHGMQSVVWLLATVTFAVAVRAQQPQFVPPEPVRDIAEIQAMASEFTFVRVVYSDKSSRAGASVMGQGAWTTDAPEAENEFSKQVEKRLGLTAKASRNLRLTDPELAKYPMIYLVEGGRLRLSDQEVAALRSYLTGGGLLIVDDFWGDEEWAALASELGRVLPGRQIIDLPADHEIFSAYYAIKSRPAVPGLAELMAGRASAEPHYRGIPAEDGRLLAILLHNLDFGDAWEHFADSNYPVESSLGGAVPIGINILVYALKN
jgi:hypothetical protein